jgi:threonine/homoserine/homoserine lactone efflux protein
VNLFFFLFKVVGISLSGVMAPGPVTAVTIAMGKRKPLAGALIAVGHGIVEFPLMILIVMGIDEVLKLPAAQIVIGLAGGAFLLTMATGMIRDLSSGGRQQAARAAGSPVIAGIVLSVGNPYFLFWWATVGLGLASEVSGLGALAFALFAVVHWLCDFVWLCALSVASYKGSTLLSERRQTQVLLVCATALRFFGVCFVVDAVRNLAELVVGAV